MGKVLVYGLGKSGKAALELLASEGFETVTYCDDGTPVDLKSLLEGIDLIVISPGIELDAPLIKAALKNNIGVIGETELASRYAKSDIIAITGTNGKTTATLMMTEILRAAHIRAHALGNIGIPFAEKVKSLSEEDVAVLEVSSFQLETIDSFRPKIGVCLNITPDHIEYHKSLAAYENAKRALFVNMLETDYAVLNFDDGTVRGFGEKVTADVFYFSVKEEVKGCYLKNGSIWWADDIAKPKKICRAEELKQRGEHNLQNALACMTVAKIIGIPDNVIKKAVADFVPPRHRIEKVGKIAGVTYFNDSKATNTDAALKACNAMTGSTVLIMGGYDKGLSFRSFFEGLPKNVTNVVCIGANKEKVRATLPDYIDFTFETADTLDEALDAAANKGAVNVLFSPATSSFDMYKDYAERGDAFVNAVMGRIGK